MYRAEFIASMGWMKTAADRAGIMLPVQENLPEVGSELLYWEHYLNQLDGLVKQSGCPHIGLLLGREVHYQEMNTNSYVLLNAASTIQELLELMAEYSQGYVSVSFLEFRKLDRVGRLTYRHLKSYSSGHVVVDLVSASITQLLRSHLGQRWNPAKVSMCRPQPDNVDPYLETLGANVNFGQRSDFIEIDAEFLQLPINETDPRLHRTMKDFVRNLIVDAARNPADIAVQLRLYLLNGLGNEDVSQEQVARTMNISRATLQRRLEANGTSYRQIRGEVLEQLAKNYLTESDVSISTIAHKLGYSETAAFTRAFSSLTGVSPRVYRNQSRAQTQRLLG